MVRRRRDLELKQYRRDTAALWSSVDPVLSAGEVGFETDTGSSKTGDGATVWSLLPYTGLFSGSPNTGVVGPGSSVDDNLMTWDGTSGYLAQDSGINISDVTANTTHRTSDGKDHSDVVLNNAHRVSDGSDHTFIDQDVTATASPTFVGLTTSGARVKNTTRVTTTYTILVSDDVVFANTDSAGFTVTLPAGVEGQTFKIINSGSTVNLLTVAPNGAEHLLGVNSNSTLNDGETLELTYNATDGWY